MDDGRDEPYEIYEFDDECHRQVASAGVADWRFGCQRYEAAKKLDWFAGCEGEYKRLHLRRRNPPSDRLLQGATGRTISLCETKPVVGADYNHRDHPLKRPFALRCNSTIATPLAMFGLPRHDVRLELGLSVSSADMPQQKSPFSPLRMP